MSVISDISKQMYFDEKIEHIAFHQYENYSEILADYRDYDTISDYLKYYYHEISSITLYLDNDTISSNEYFVHVDQEIAKVMIDAIQELMNNVIKERVQKEQVNARQKEVEFKMLAKIMRRNIQVSNTLQPLKSELKLVEYYLKIQDYRFHDRIHYCIETEGDIEPLKVMPLLIQPFVENAFVHGLEAKESGGEIVIRVEVNCSRI
mgnify:FL=1